MHSDWKLHNISERKSMFELYLKDIDLPTSLSYQILSDRSAGMTGADIANIAKAIIQYSFSFWGDAGYCVGGITLG